MKQILTALLVMLTWLSTSSGARAAEFSISPTRIQLAPGDLAGSVTITNDGDETVTVQVETFAWRRSESIADLDPTRDLIAVPPFFDVGPGQRQIVRVGLRRPGSPDVETAYRVVLSEVPNTDLASGLGIQFALRLSLPVFVTPPGAVPDPQINLARGAGGYRLAVNNRGNAHIRILSLKIQDPRNGETVARADQPVYLLAGQQREIDVPAAERNAAALPLDATIIAQTSAGEMTLTANAR